LRTGEDFATHFGMLEEEGRDLEFVKIKKKNLELIQE
jgi:hypothetical protein